MLLRRALRTALIPLTTVTALDISAPLGGAILAEVVFQWHGMGVLFLQALGALDVNLPLGWLLLTAVIIIAFNLRADIRYVVFDPTIRQA